MRIPFLRRRPNKQDLPVAGQTATERIYRPGDFIAGKYEVLKVFEGGLGRVYVIADGGERFVLKTIKAVSDDRAKAAFQREARAWISLGRHPNIVPAFWVDDVAGQLCVAAEFIEPDARGRTTLRDHITGQNFSLQQLLRWSAEFCFGLDHALRCGMRAHRDIKPENLLIGKGEVLQLSDFGLASVASRRFEGGRAEISGTPPYMAPEQWIGSEQTVCTDVYAFGVVLYELCFGRMPFSARSISELARAHIGEIPRVPEHPLARVITSCLAKTASARPEGPDVLLDMLKYVAKANGLALPPRPTPLDQEQLELLALASVGAVGDTETALRAAQTLTTRWPLGAAGWTQLGRIYYEIGDFTAAEAATKRSLQIDPTRSAPWNNLGLILMNRNAHEASVEALKRALDADPDNTGAMANLAEPLRALQRHGQAIDYLIRATQLAPDKHVTWVNLGSLYAVLDMNSEAAEALQRSLDLAPTEKREEIRSFLEEIRARPIRAKRGSALMMEGRVAEALSLLVEEAKAEPNDPVVVQNLAIAHLHLGQNAAAANAFEHLHRIEPDNQLAWMHLMQLASKRGDLVEAERWCAKYAKLPGMTGRSKAFWAYVLEENGQLQPARNVLLDAMKQYPEEPDIFVAYGDFAMKHNVPRFAVEAYRNALQLIAGQSDSIERFREIEARLHRAVSAADLER
jgi:serine/threonine protein kinase